MYKKSKFNIFLITYTALLLILPFGWWDNNLNMLGGDDTKIIYFNPSLYLNSIINSNVINFSQAESILIQETSNAPFYAFLFVINKTLPFLNLQLLIFGMVLSFSFIGFYWMSSNMPGIKNENSKSEEIIRFTAANMYTLSTFAIYTLWDHQLYPLIYMASCPIIFGIFLRSSIKFSINKCLAASILIAFIPLYSNLPWLIPILICGIPFFFFMALNSPRNFLYTCVTIVVTSGILVFTIPLIAFTFQSYSSGMFLPDVIAGSVRAFLEVNSNNIAINFFAFIPPQQFQISRLWLFQEYPIAYLIIQNATSCIVILLCILMGIVFFMNKKSLIKNNILMGILLSYLLSFILYTGGNKYIMEILARGMKDFSIFIMFRNNYDKFSLAVTIYSSILIIYALTTFNNLIQNYKKN